MPAHPIVRAVTLLGGPAHGQLVPSTGQRWVVVPVLPAVPLTVPWPASTFAQARYERIGELAFFVELS